MQDLHGYISTIYQYHAVAALLSPTSRRHACGGAKLLTLISNTGVIAVATDSEPVIELNGVEKIVGDSIAEDNPHVTTLASDSLIESTGQTVFSNLSVLANISLPKWEKTPKIVLERIPSPSYTNFQQKGQQIDEVYVRNTTFAFFSGLTLVGAQIQVLEIVENPYLQLVSFMAGNITDHAKITGNGGDLTLDLPNLTYAYSLEISNASDIRLPMLSSVSNGFDVSYSEVSELSMPELAYVGGDLVLTGNRHLNDIELEQLVNIQGSIEISNNEDLGEISGLSYLSSIGGNMDLIGAFDTIDLPALSIVRNNIAITSTSSLNCTDVPASVAQGDYSCKSGASSTALDDSSTSSDTAGSGLSAGVKAGIALGVTALVALLSLLAFFVYQRRKRNLTPVEHNPADSTTSAALGYTSRGFDDNASHHPSENKENYELEYYSVHPHHLDGSSQKELIQHPPQRSSEMGKPLSGSHPGPEGRHEMFNAKDPPAAAELVGSEVKAD